MVITTDNINLGTYDVQVMQSNKYSGNRVSDLVEPVTAFGSSEPITRVAGYLKETHLHEAIIEDKDRTALISMRDLLDVENIASQRITKVMKQVPKISIEDNLSDVAKVMLEHRTKSLPVYDGPKLVGKITSSAIAKTLVTSENAGESVARIATPNPICVEYSDSAAKAKRLMVDWKIDQLPILKNRKLVGIITAESVVAKFLPSTDRSAVGQRRSGRLEIDVSKLSEPQTISNDVSDTMKATIENMLKSGSSYSVITGSDEVQGIVTYYDFIKLLASPSAKESPISIVGLPEDPLQSEMSKQKFQSSVKLLQKAWPHLTEARAIIKSGQSKAPKKRYEVQVFLSSENSHHNYKVVNYDLAKAFEEIEIWIKKLATRHGKSKARKRESSRRLLSPNFPNERS